MKPAELEGICQLWVTCGRFEGSNLSSGKAKVYSRAGICDIGLIWQRGHDPPATKLSRASALMGGTVDHLQGCAGVVAGRTIGDQEWSGCRTLLETTSEKAKM